MAAPDELIIVVNRNGKAAVWRHFRLIKRPGNFKLDEITAVYLSSAAATSWVPRISGTFWVGTIRLPFPNPR